MIPRKKLGRTGLEVSRIALGTTEIGFIYGIGPRNVPTTDEAVQFLKKAVSLGVTFIDTAHFYGHAEEAIGRSGIATMDNVVIATKAGHILDRAEEISSVDLEKTIRQEIEDSRARLNLATLPLVLYHGGSEEQIRSGLLIEIMQKLKDEGKVRFAGISTRGEEAPLAAIASGFFDVVQIAYSILDQRMAPRVLVEAGKNNIGIVNRSVFLKGVLTPAVAHLTDQLAPLKQGSEKARKIADAGGMDLPTLALRFSLSHDTISTSLVGTNKEHHLESAVRAAEAGPLPQDMLDALYALAITDITLVDPAHWPPSSVADQKDGKKIAPHFHESAKK